MGGGAGLGWWRKEPGERERIRLEDQEGSQKDDVCKRYKGCFAMLFTVGFVTCCSVSSGNCVASREWLLGRRPHVACVLSEEAEWWPAGNLQPTAV